MIGRIDWSLDSEKKYKFGPLLGHNIIIHCKRKIEHGTDLIRLIQT